MPGTKNAEFGNACEGTWREGRESSISIPGWTTNGQTHTQPATGAACFDMTAPPGGREVEMEGGVAPGAVS